VLDSARRCSNAEISRRRGVVADTVRLRRGRYADEGMAGLADRRRSGRPPRFTPAQAAEVKALACQLPAETGVPLARWSCPDRDPDFAAKARVLDLYARVFDGSPLGDGEYVTSSDEETSIQARCRCHPTLPPGRSRTMRVNHEYERGGALAYLAAYDVHRAHVTGLCSDTTGIDPFTDLVDEVMTQEPYASARRVFWIVDNGSSHRGKAAIDRLTARYPNTIMIHTPVHASWLNQVEIFFSIVQRKVVSPNDFTDLDQVQDRLTAFEQRYNATAQPFRWKFTPADLEDLLARIERHEQKERTQQHEHDHQPALPAAA
jgi:hypothetical protein